MAVQRPSGPEGAWGLQVPRAWRVRARHGFARLASRALLASAANRCWMNGSTSAPSSATTNCTRSAMSPEIKWTSRLRRSSFATSLRTERWPSDKDLRPSDWRRKQPRERPSVPIRNGATPACENSWSAELPFDRRVESSVSRNRVRASKNRRQVARANMELFIATAGCYAPEREPSLYILPHRKQ